MEFHKENAHINDYHNRSDKTLNEVFVDFLEDVDYDDRGEIVKKANAIFKQLKKTDFETTPKIRKDFLKLVELVLGKIKDQTEQVMKQIANDEPVNPVGLWTAVLSLHNILKNLKTERVKNEKYPHWTFLVLKLLEDQTEIKRALKQKIIDSFIKEISGKDKGKGGGRIITP